MTTFFAFAPQNLRRNQQSILEKYAKENGFRNPRVFIDESVILGTSQETLMSQGFPDLALIFIWPEVAGLIGG